MAPKTRSKKDVSPTAPAPTTTKGKGKGKGKALPSDDPLSLNCFLEGTTDTITIEVAGSRSISWIKELFHQMGVNRTVCEFARDLIFLKVTTQSAESQAKSSRFTFRCFPSG